MDKLIKKYRKENYWNRTGVGVFSQRLFIATLLLPILLSSCHIFKKSTRNNDKGKVVEVKQDSVIITQPVKDTITAVPHPPAVDSTVAENRNPALLSAIGSVWQRPLNYTTFNGKAKMRYEGGNSTLEFTANFRIQKDKVIWVLITAFGGMFTVARVYITPDSIKYINYAQKEAAQMSISQAATILPTPADFTMLQNLIIGLPLKQSGTAKNVEDLVGKWILQAEDNEYLQKNTYSKTDTTLQAGQLNTHNPNGPQASVDYGKYSDINGIKFSNERAVNLVNNGTQYHLNMDFSSAAFNENIDFPFSIPKNYTVK